MAHASASRAEDPRFSGLDRPMGGPLSCFARDARSPTRFAASVEVRDVFSDADEMWRCLVLMAAGHGRYRHYA